MLLPPLNPAALNHLPHCPPRGTQAVPPSPEPLLPWGLPPGWHCTADGCDPASWMTFPSLYLWGYLPRPYRERAKRKISCVQNIAFSTMLEGFPGQMVRSQDIYLHTLSTPFLTVTESVWSLQCGFPSPPCLCISSESLCLFSSIPSCYCVLTAS